MLAQSRTGVYAVEELFEAVEERKRRLAHEVEHGVGGVLWGNLEAPGHVVDNKLAVVVGVGAVHGLVAGGMHG